VSGQRNPRAQAKRREKRKRALREFVLELFTLAGGLVGFLWMVNTWDTTPPDCDTKKGSAEFVGECIKQSFSESLYPVLAKVGVCLFAGLVVAALLCATLPGLKRRPA
jgi:hypothetical protein